jgi:hypothetical protein
LEGRFRIPGFWRSINDVLSVFLQRAYQINIYPVRIPKRITCTGLLWDAFFDKLALFGGFQPPRVHRNSINQDQCICQTGKMLNCLSFYLDGEIYTSLYHLDARHPDPPQLGFIGPHDSPVGISEMAVVGVGDSDTSAKIDFTIHLDVRQTANRV